MCMNGHLNYFGNIQYITELHGPKTPKKKIQQMSNLDEVWTK